MQYLISNVCGTFKTSFKSTEKMRSVFGLSADFRSREKKQVFSAYLYRKIFIQFLGFFLLHFKIYFRTFAKNSVKLKTDPFYDSI